MPSVVNESGSERLMDNARYTHQIIPGTDHHRIPRVECHTSTGSKPSILGQSCQWEQRKVWTWRRSIGVEARRRVYVPHEQFAADRAYCVRSRIIELSVICQGDKRAKSR